MMGYILRNICENIFGMMHWCKLHMISFPIICSEIVLMNTYNFHGMAHIVFMVSIFWKMKVT